MNDAFLKKNSARSQNFSDGNEGAKNKIAICFFGITRSLTHTIGSIEQNILTPARELGEVRIFAHFFQQATIDNPRSGESGPLRQDEHRLLSPDWLELEEPGLCLERLNFHDLKKWGDTWSDDFRSLRNLVHQLHSLSRATTSALEWNPDLVIFARPDLLYHDSLRPVLHEAMALGGIFLPGWQRWRGGYNDRFAVCAGTQLASLYGHRVELLHRFCREEDQPLHAELLLRFALRPKSQHVHFRAVRASRVRLGGEIKKEDFMPFQIRWIIKLPRRLVSRIRKSIVNEGSRRR